MIVSADKTPSAGLSSARRHGAVSAILLGGVVAGTVDIGAACLIYDRSVPFILQSIAGGLLAERAFSGGTATVMLGALLQELMGILIAAIYLCVSLAFPTLARRWPAYGLLYGVIIYVVMNYGVLPLSAWHRTPPLSASTFFPNMLAMLLFGLIVAYFARARAVDLKAL